MKGQYFSFDAIIAAVIFIMALVALLSYWHSVKSYLDYQADPLSTEAVRISNLLFTPPSPLPPPNPASVCDGMTRLGFSLSWDDRRVNSSIIDCAQSTAANPEWLGRVLGTPYNVSITVRDLSQPSSSPLIIGTPASAGVQNVVNMRRLTTVVNPDGSTYLAAFDLSLYTNQPG